MDFLTWQESIPFSCGASCLMTALTELLSGKMSRKREMEIWEELHPSYYPGILPGAMAQYAVQREVFSQLIYSEETVLKVLDKLASIYDPVKHILFSDNRSDMERLSQEGIPVHYCEKEKLLERVIQNFLKDQKKRLIVGIELSYQNLHYILVRRDHNGNFVVMDPAIGSNTVYSQKEFLKDFQNHLIGVFVLLG